VNIRAGSRPEFISFVKISRSSLHRRTMYFFIAFLKVLGDMIKVALRKYTIICDICEKFQLIYPTFLC
jgi:hypothetical protein